MKRHRKIISIGCSVVASLGALPAVSEAGPLLSGYGGPGEGNQAILGSALLNGPGGGGGGGRGGAGGVGTRAGSQVANGSSSTVAAAGTTSSPSSVTTDATSTLGGTRQRAPRKEARARGRQKPAVASSFYPASETLPAGQQSTALGLSGEDLVLLILAACAVVLIGAFVRQLTRPARRDGVGG
jgi:hypothetical protein